MTENDVAREIVDACLKIHKALGPGLLESVYETVLAVELRKRGLDVDTQVTVPVIYEDVSIDNGFRADMIVSNVVVVELKSVEHIIPVHKKQLLTYLRLSGRKLGILANFGEELMKDGITRIIN
jgi:GxxExxY protein